MMKVKKFKTEFYLDGADIADFKKYKNNSLIKGFTTNPSLMRKAGVINYEKFCKKSLKIIKKNLFHLKYLQMTLMRLDIKLN